jgi:hypothetical protein
VGTLTQKYYSRSRKRSLAETQERYQWLSKVAFSSLSVEEAACPPALAAFLGVTAASPAPTPGFWDESANL